MSSSQDQSAVDKEALYGRYTERTTWQDKLFRKGCHKALDIPDDDMNFNNQQGISGKHLLGVGAMVLAGLLGWRAMDIPSAPSVDILSSSDVAPLPQEYDVTFWVDGEEIAVTEPKE